MISKKKNKKISETKKESKKRGKTSLPAASTVLTKDSPFVVKEAYKALRSNIIFSLPSKGCKKVGVTSSYTGEGKSTNCLNLAICFAEMGAKTLIIDADLRRPNIARLLNEKEPAGLSNILVGLKSYQDVLYKNVRENLDVIFSGEIPPNPTELLINENMSNLMEELSSQYEYIFVDCPPVNVVTDASIVSKLVTGMILVVKHNETTKDDVAEAKAQLDFAGAKILGTILNAVHMSGSKYGYGRTYKGYHKYYRSESHKKEYGLMEYYADTGDGANTDG